MSAPLCPASLPPHCFLGLQQHAHPPFFLYLLSSSAITHLSPGPAPAILTLGKSSSVSALAALRAGLSLVIMHAFLPAPGCSARLFFSSAPLLDSLRLPLSLPLLPPHPHPALSKGLSKPFTWECSAPASSSLHQPACHLVSLPPPKQKSSSAGL